MAADPPAWLLLAQQVLAVASCVMLIMYFAGRLECDKLVRYSLACQLAIITLVLVASAHHA